MSDKAAVWLKQYLGVSVYRALVFVGVWGLYYYMGSTYVTRTDHGRDIDKVSSSLEAVRSGLQAVSEKLVKMNGIDDQTATIISNNREEILRLRNRLDAEK